MAEPAITLVTQVGLCALYGYIRVKCSKDEQQQRKKIICEKVRIFQNELDTFDHSKIGNLINIVEMEIKIMPEISNLTFAERLELKQFCDILLWTDKETLEAAGIIINDKKYAKISNIYEYCCKIISRFKKE